MPAIMFRQCTCGMEIKILYLVDDTRQFYVCGGCNRSMEVLGTVLKIYTCAASTFGRQRNWVQVPPESLRSEP
jgi:hypothetical protein